MVVDGVSGGVPPVRWHTGQRRAVQAGWKRGDHLPAGGIQYAHCYAAEDAHHECENEGFFAAVPQDVPRVGG